MRISLCALLASALSSCSGQPARPPSAPAPEIDLSGKWECLWEGGLKGKENWLLMQDAGNIRVTFTGHDLGGGYSGSVTGTIKENRLDLAYKLREEGAHGWIKLKVSGNARVLDGEAKPSEAKAPLHFACAAGRGSPTSSSSPSSAQGSLLKERHAAKGGAANHPGDRECLADCERRAERCPGTYHDISFCNDDHRYCIINCSRSH